MPTKVNIIIISYKRDDLFAQAITSLRASCDTGLVDITPVCMECSRGKLDIVYQLMQDGWCSHFIIDKKMEGHAFALNQAMSSNFIENKYGPDVVPRPLSRYEYTILLDDDDTFTPEWVEILIQVYEHFRLNPIEGYPIIALNGLHTPDPNCPNLHTVEYKNDNFLHTANGIPVHLKSLTRQNGLFINTQDYMKYWPFDYYHPGSLASGDWCIQHHENSFAKLGKYILSVPGLIQHMGATRRMWGNASQCREYVNQVTEDK